MALLYGMLRIVAMALRQLAVWKHARTKRLYEAAEQSFHEVEKDCKCHEVRVGRPVDYRAQLKLLKAFEVKDAARTRWMAAGKSLEARKQREASLRSFGSRKLPYTFGLADMALVMSLLDRLGVPLRLDLVSLAETVWTRWYN